MPNTFARDLRRCPTDAERELWRHLRHRQIEGLKFRRQFPIGPFVCDFVCLQRRVVIELDGSQHADHAAYDDDRTAFLKRSGFSVVRFWNGDVFTKPLAVIATIRAACGEAW